MNSKSLILRGKRSAASTVPDCSLQVRSMIQNALSWCSFSCGGRSAGLLRALYKSRYMSHRAVAFILAYILTFPVKSVCCMCSTFVCICCERSRGGGGKRYFALAGNRTRASRVAGENSTTEPPMHLCKSERGQSLSRQHSAAGSHCAVSFLTYKIEQFSL